jgi:HSP20 family protein
MLEQAKTAAPVKKPTSPALLKLVPPADLFERAERIYDSVARRAFEIFESNGRDFGRDLENWLRAEAELLHPVHVDITEAEGSLAVKAEVPGFTANELEVSVEPTRLTISGKRQTKEEHTEKKAIYRESCSDQIMRTIDLPHAVDATKATATLKDGILELRVPKAEPPTKVTIQEKAANGDVEC